MRLPRVSLEPKLELSLPPAQRVSLRAAQAVATNPPEVVDMKREQEVVSAPPVDLGVELPDQPISLGPNVTAKTTEEPAPAPVATPAEEPPPESEDLHDRATLTGDDPKGAVGKIQDRFALGDYSGALVLAEALLDEDPGNASAERYADSCREMLRGMYLSRIGEGTFVPRIVMGQDQLRWLTLDHRAGFLLSCVDGTSSVDEILDVCGMAPLDALRTMYELKQQGAIAVEAPPTKRK
jgi:hypothetical protein